MSEKLRFLVLLLAAGVVLAGPFIYDNGLRALWVTLGLATTLWLLTVIIAAIPKTASCRKNIGLNTSLIAWTRLRQCFWA